MHAARSTFSVTVRHSVKLNLKTGNPTCCAIVIILKEISLASIAENDVIFCIFKTCLADIFEQSPIYVYISFLIYIHEARCIPS